MPQFDITTFSSQIFWFAICFFVLYFFLSKILLPRIREIVENRKNVIDSDLTDARTLESEIAALKNKSADMMREAELSYRKKIEESAKQASDHKEKEIERFKIDSKNATKKSKKQVAELIEKSKNDVKKLSQDLASSIEKKILG